jgi:RNA polymerase sigma-70 factor (ECF subfamily)
VALPFLGELVRVATRVVCDRTRAEDLVQETYLQAWRSFTQFQTCTNCRAWLYKILFRTIGRAHRTQATRPRTVDLDSAPERALQVDAPPIDPLARAQLVAAVDALPEHFRAVFLLADVEQLRYREIAEVLGLPMGTVMSRLSRARGHLRAALQPGTVRLSRVGS